MNETNNLDDISMLECAVKILKLKLENIPEFIPGRYKIESALTQLQLFISNFNSIRNNDEFLHSFKYLLSGQKDKDFPEFGLTFRNLFHNALDELLSICRKHKEDL